VKSSGVPTPRGKRSFLDSLRWGERGLGGFGTSPLTPELTGAQNADVRRLLDLEQYKERLAGELGDSVPLRARHSKDFSARMRRKARAAWMRAPSSAPWN
jgi:hypothetical protein